MTVAAAGATLTVLGAGSILPRAPRDGRTYGCAGYALRPAPGAPVTLFDCGPGSVRALGPAGIALADVRRVILSHFHLDHCLDLFALTFARKNPAFAAPPLERIGPRGLARLCDAAPDALGRYAVDPAATTREVAPGERVEAPRAEGVRFTSVATGHTPEALAWRADLALGASLCYTGDTGASPDVARLARGVDLLVAECSFPDDQAVPHHLTPTSAARLARDAGARTLLLTHFYPANDPEQARDVAARTFRGAIELAYDGAAFELAPGGAVIPLGA